MNNNSDQVSINSYEYERLKRLEQTHQELDSADFALKIARGPVTLQPSHNEQVDIEIFSIDFHTVNTYSIHIFGKTYDLSQDLFDKIKDFIDEHLNTLINWSKTQTNSILANDTYIGGHNKTITVKYGQLIINVNGQVQDIEDSYDKLIDSLIEIVTNKNN